MTLRFDGKVAVVTGAGNGLGKEYAKMLASRGAKVVINDLGGSHTGTGASTTAADMVVEEIKAAGGEAVANYDSVTDGDKIVQTAIDTWGRVDIVINNAGILRDVGFKKMTQQDWDLVYQVHCLGAFKVAHAAYAHMDANGYGRIVNISSPSGLYGNRGQVNYSSMKMAAIGMTLSLAKEGAKKNIKANVIAPIAASRIMASVMSEKGLAEVPTTSVANLVCYLCHESCESTGGMFEMAGSWMARLRWERSKGVVFQDGFSMDDVAARFAEISDMSAGTQHPPEDGQSAFDLAMSKM